MSKAFTKEDEAGLDLNTAIIDAEAAEIAAEAEGVSAGPQYITPEGHKKLSDELDRLWRLERPCVTREVEAAAALGDRSENAEYIYGKKRLREIDRRLRFLSKRLDRVTVVTAKPEHAGRVYFGAYVGVVDEDGKETVYRLVGSDEIDLDKRWVSLDSPVGKALLGKKRGDVVTLRRPKGEVELEIVSIHYT